MQAEAHFKALATDPNPARYIKATKIDDLIVLLMDRAGWHTTSKLEMPANASVQTGPANGVWPKPAGAQNVSGPRSLGRGGASGQSSTGPANDIVMQFSIFDVRGGEW